MKIDFQVQDVEHTVEAGRR